MLRGLWAAALVAWVALPLPAKGLRLGAGRRNFAPDFAACDSPGPCGSEGQRSHYLLDLLPGAGRAAHLVAASGRQPVLLHIGAADLGNIARFADLDLYAKTVSLLPEDVRQSFALALVEPNDSLFPRLAKNAKRLPINVSQVKLVHGMVADSCSTPYVSMYRFSIQAEKDFGAWYNVYRTWFSANKGFPLSALNTFASYDPSPPFTEDHMKAFRRFNNAKNASAYLEEIQVHCHTPSSLLASLGHQASDLAMVVIDAEGYDTSIMQEFIKLPGFKPGYVQWETPDAGELGISLQELGFKVANVRTSGSNSDASNAVAVLAEPSMA